MAVLGGGSFGTAIAYMIATNKIPVTLWMRSEENAQKVVQQGENAAYLPGYKLDASLKIRADLNDVVSSADVIFFAVPSSSFRGLAGAVQDIVQPGAFLISTAKGIEPDSFMLPSQILEEQLPQCKIGVISGPNLAAEIAQYQITATVVASENAIYVHCSGLLVSKYFRVYANQDRYGVELAGALKIYMPSMYC